MTNHYIDSHIQPLDLSQENANLRDLLNASMAENVALLQQVTEMQEALDGTRALWMASMVKCNGLEFEAENAEVLIERIRVTMNGYADSDLVSLATTLNACAKQQDALLAWSQAAYKRLGGLMAIGVSMTPDAVTAALLDGAPANVAAEVDPFGATVDELMKYAADSVGASGIKTIEGCYSAGLHRCYGELWTCTGCGNRFCDAEGSDDGFIDFCDECWAKMQGDMK